MRKIGFNAGETVYFTGARQLFSNGDQLEFGLSGVILSESSSQRGNADDHDVDHVRVRFEGHKDFTNARITDLSEQPPEIPGGFHVGDQVYWIGAAEKFPSGDRLRFGMAGEVVGCSSLGIPGNDGCIAVHFNGNSKITDVLLSSISKASPATKCVPGERIYFTGARQSFINGDSLSFGMPGKVISMKTVSGNEIRLAVQFEGNKSATPLSLTQISRSPPAIPGGYEVGDVVMWRGKAQTLANGDRLEVGLTGEVVGRPCARFDGKDEERILVQFEEHRQNTPVLVSSILRSGL